MAYLKIDQLLERLKSGILNFTPYVVMKDGENIYPQYEESVNEAGGTAVLSAEYEGKFRDVLYLTYTEEEILCKRVFENISDTVISVRELAVELKGITFGGVPREDYFYHNENPRIYEVMTFPIDYNRTAEGAKDSNFDVQAGNRWADPGVVSERIGASPYQPFPAILISNYQSCQGLVHGTLSQRIFFHNYLAGHENDKVTLKIFSSLKATGYLEAAPGRVLTDEWYLGRTDEADNIEKIFEGYTTVLRDKLPTGYGRTDINRDTVVWGSWNDGIFRDVNEDLLVEEAQFLKENFPTVGWVQLDDGYTVYNKSAYGLGAPYEGEEGIDHVKFPGGLRRLTDKIKAIGLRPALWIGGFCPHETKIYKEHPEWFMDYSYRTPDTSPLDVSQKEVREYMTDAINVLLQQYGFEGLKYDFGSYAFEDSHTLYKNHDKSGYEYRTWWHREFRNALPKDGYMETACDLCMGNPFLGENLTNYRCGIDIGTGNWDHVRTNFLWGTAIFATHTGDLSVPNSDSIGLLPTLSENEAMFCVNYCIVTHTLVEIAGRLSKTDKFDRLKVLKKAVCSPNNGQDIYFIRYDYRTPSYNVPEMIYFMTPHFSKEENNVHLPVRTIGIFNVWEEEKEYTFSVDDLKLPSGEYVLTDVWSGEQFELTDSYTLTVAARASRLFAVSRKGGVQLYDANIRILSASGDEESLCLATDYACKEAELTFDRPVRALYFDGVPLTFAAEGTTVSANLPGKGTLTVQF